METTSPKPEIQNTENPASWKIGIGSLLCWHHGCSLFFSYQLPGTNEQYATVIWFLSFVSFNSQDLSTSNRSSNCWEEFSYKETSSQYRLTWLLHFYQFGLFVVPILIGVTNFVLLHDFIHFRTTLWWWWMEKNQALYFPFLFFVAIPWPLKMTYNHPMATVQGILYHCGYFTFDGTYAPKVPWSM